jgi:hypothetical protein
MFAFQASAGFKDVSERTKETGSTFIEDKADCKLYKVTINIYSPPKFHANFITGLKTLGLYPQTKDKFCKFFKYFGTHVPESIVLGARFGHITQIDTNSNSSSKETTVNASIGASYAGIGGKVSTEVSNKNSDSNSSLIKNKKSFSIGSKPEEEGHGLKWAQKEIEAPMPIQYEMMEITTALELTGKKQELKEGGIANADGLIVEMNKALKSYCEDCLVPAGLISNCEAAKDVASNAKITIVQTNTPYLLKNVETGNCLTFTSRTNFVESKPCTNEQSQKWKLENAEGYYKVKTLQEDSVLDVPGAVSDEGTAMKAYDTPKDKIYKNQVFKFLLDRTNGLYTIEPLYVKKCLQIQDDSIFSGARVIMMTCNGKRSQQWRVVTI